MQHLGAVVSQLYSFCEGNFRQRSSSRANQRIGSENAVYIRPDPDFISSAGRSQDGSRVIRAAAPESSGASEPVSSCIACNHRQCALCDQRQKVLFTASDGEVHLRRCITEMTVCSNGIFSRNKPASNAQLLKIISEYPCGNPFTERGQGVLDLRGDITTQGQQRIAGSAEGAANAIDKIQDGFEARRFKKLNDQLTMN